MVTHERRRSPRKLVSLSALVSPDNAPMFSMPVRALVFDLNRTGAHIQATELLRPGEFCNVTLIGGDGSSADIDARIVWVELDDQEKKYDAGIAFRNLTPDNSYLVDLQMMRSAR